VIRLDLEDVVSADRWAELCVVNVATRSSLEQANKIQSVLTGAKDKAK
jgi:hypothetical protein